MCVDVNRARRAEGEKLPSRIIPYRLSIMMIFRSCGAAGDPVLRGGGLSE